MTTAHGAPTRAEPGCTAPAYWNEQANCWHRPKPKGKRMLTRIHVNLHHIKANAKADPIPCGNCVYSMGQVDPDCPMCDGTGEWPYEPKPVLTVKTHKSSTYANEVEIDGPARVVYRPDNPLPCGAHVWIETKADVTTR
jgi:hypothetical protein